MSDLTSNTQDNINQMMDNVIESSFIDCANSIVEGTVSMIDDENQVFYVDVGLKSDGMISMKEFFLTNERESIVVGSKVKVFLESLDLRSSGVSLSRAKAIREIAFAELKVAHANGDHVHGIAFSRVKGGVSVDFNGVIAFLPGSQIDSRPTRDISHLIGKLLPYKVLSIDSSYSVVVSYRAILESERVVEKQVFLDSMQEGIIVQGTVKNITNYGAFIDLGDVDGLLHITDISWEKISHPSEVLSIGQSVSLRVVKYDKATGRLSLSMKYLEDNPWKQIEEKYKKDQIVKGKVTNITTYGVFVLLELGVEGLLHVSEMSWTRKDEGGKRNIQVDDEIEVFIVEIDPKRHRIALSTRRLCANPWEEFSQSHEISAVLDGIVSNVAEFGLFVSIDNSKLDGLVHISDLIWNGDAQAALSKYKQGDKIKVMYLGSDLKHQRIRLGIKQLEHDPFLDHKDKIQQDKIITCSVVDIKEDGIEVEIFGSIRSFIKRSNIARDKEERRAKRFVVGDRVDAKIVSFNEATRDLVLSIKSVEDDHYEKMISDYGAVDSGETIRKVLGEALSNSIADESSSKKK